MDIKIDIARAKSSAVGMDHGVTPAELKAIEPRVLKAHKRMQADRKKKAYGFYDLHKDAAPLSAVKKMARSFKGKGIENLVVLGIGGSALGITTLFSALKSPYHNLLSEDERGGIPRLFVMDNVDPDTFAEMLRICPPGKTLYNVISKSGGTAETLSQCLIVLDELKKHISTDTLKDHIVMTLSPPVKGARLSPLQHLQKKYVLPAFHIPLNVGGRFSILLQWGCFPQR